MIVVAAATLRKPMLTARAICACGKSITIEGRYPGRGLATCVFCDRPFTYTLKATI